MTAKMTRKNLNSLDMKVVRAKTRRIFRKKHGKLISKSDINKVWKDFCEFGIVNPLIKYGEVKVGKDLEFKIIGKRDHNNSLLHKGFHVNKAGYLTKTDKFSDTKLGITYKITAFDSNYKNGKLIFKSHPWFSGKIHEALKNPNTYYKIEK